MQRCMQFTLSKASKCFLTLWKASNCMQFTSATCKLPFQKCQILPFKVSGGKDGTGDEGGGVATNAATTVTQEKGEKAISASAKEKEDTNQDTQKKKVTLQAHAQLFIMHVFPHDCNCTVLLEEVGLWDVTRLLKWDT